MKLVFNTITLTCSCSLNQYLQKWSEAFKAAKYISQISQIARYDELKISSSAWDPLEIIISICWTDIPNICQNFKNFIFLQKILHWSKWSIFPEFQSQNLNFNKHFKPLLRYELAINCQRGGIFLKHGFLNSRLWIRGCFCLSNTACDYHLGFEPRELINTQQVNLKNTKWWLIKQVIRCFITLGLQCFT